MSTFSKKQTCQEINEQIEARHAKLRDLAGERLNLMSDSGISVKELSEKELPDEFQMIENQVIQLEQEIMDLKFNLNELTHFNRLPNEMIGKIFSNLNVNELINALLVCRRWHASVLSRKPTSLIVYEKRLDRMDRWTFDDVLFDPNVAITFVDLKKIDLSKLINSHFASEILRLNINNFNDFYNEDIQTEIVCNKQIIDFINSIGSLLVLEIDCLNLKDARITLPRLQMMEVKIIRARIILNTPALTHFKCLYGDQLRMIYFPFSNSLTHLYVSQYDYSINVCHRFDNITSLYVENGLSANLLMDLPLLKELYVHAPIRSSRYINLQKEVVDILHRNYLEACDLRIVFYGFELKEVTQLQEIKENENGELFTEFAFDETNLIKLLVKNFPKMVYTNWMKEINYFNVYKGLVRVPMDFYEEFPNIHQVNINNRILDYQDLIEFLKPIRELDRLKLENTYLNNSTFYDLLPENCCKKLFRIHISEKDDLEIDFEFILKLLKDPVAVVTNQQVPLSIVERAFKKFRKDFVFSFGYKENQMEISQNKVWTLIIKHEEDRPLKFVTLNDLLQHVNSLP